MESLDIIAVAILTLFKTGNRIVWNACTCLVSTVEENKLYTHIMLYCSLNLPLHLSSLFSYVHSVVNISFSQMTYRVPESEEVILKISLDKAPLEDILFTVNTMDITAQCEY